MAKKGYNTSQKFTVFNLFCQERDIIPSSILSACFLCEYTRQLTKEWKGCMECPADWAAETCQSPGAIYRRWEKSTSIEERSLLAYEIAHGVDYLLAMEPPPKLSQEQRIWTSFEENLLIEAFLNFCGTRATLHGGSPRSIACKVRHLMKHKRIPTWSSRKYKPLP